jgi:hypothetical protein
VSGKSAENIITNFNKSGVINMEQITLTRKDREKIRHKEEILKAALNLFSSKGFNNVSMQDIALESEFALYIISSRARNNFSLNCSMTVLKKSIRLFPLFFKADCRKMKKSELT